MTPTTASNDRGADMGGQGQAFRGVRQTTRPITVMPGFMGSNCRPRLKMNRGQVTIAVSSFSEGNGDNR